MAFIRKGTGDDGDSIYHYLFSRYAFIHPQNFVDHWAKPVYVFFSAPFAQFGFAGIKIFNVTVTTLAIFFTYRITQLLQVKNGWFAVLALCCAPMYIRLSLSGLTEPLFALSLVIVIFLALRQKLVYAMLLASFLPFMRSEGLVILIVCIVFLLFKRRYKIIPLLATGHVVYSLIGWFYYRDFLWVFNKMTYAVWNSSYGSGSALTFIYGMKDFIGWPLVVLFCIGTLTGLVWTFKDLFGSQKNLIAEELLLVYGSFFSIWISHMIFWSWGLFNSLGLIRVLIAVVPCAGIICLHGFNCIVEWKIVSENGILKKCVIMVMVVAVFINPFLQLQSQCAFDLSGNQQTILRAAEKYKDQLNDYTIYSSSGYAAVAFGYDIFDSTRYRKLQEIHQEKQMAVKSAVIWDDFYAPNETKTALANLMVDERFEWLDTFQSKDCLGYLSQSAVFLYKGELKSNWKVADTLFTNEFENEKSDGRDSVIVFSGKYSCRVNESNGYAPGFTTEVRRLGFLLPGTIQVGAMFYASQIPFDQQKHAVFVISLEHNSEVYFWKGLDIDNEIRDLRIWKKVFFNIQIPVPKDSVDVLKVYVWNPHAPVIYLDDLSVLRIEPK
ncbi:MAG: hypothetical protein WBB36_06835 [Chitinophagales bacterium]